MSNSQNSQINVQKVTIDDLLEVLALGLQDFKTAPLYGLFFSGIFVVGG